MHETAERRQVTILHCDIVDSTSLVTRLDPEETMSVVRAYMDRCAASVDIYDGTVATYTGDGFQAYFGYPVAQEDPAVDAVMAALEVQRILSSPDADIPFELVCRIGIATGRVVVNQRGQGMADTIVEAFGTTTHLAARLEQAATPRSVFIDSATKDLCRDRFLLREVGTVAAKGFEQDVE
ncbi:MAG: adenylate/guanylate cyclase domain-containing protein, partial [Methyloligellaceae bacterium]